MKTHFDILIRVMLNLYINLEGIADDGDNSHLNFKHSWTFLSLPMKS